MKVAVNEIQITTGTKPTSMIAGEGVVAEFLKAKISPTRKHNDLFEKTMFHWGMVLGLDIWSRIP